VKRKLLWVVLLLTMTVGSRLAAQGDTFPNGVASGDVTQTNAVLWARSTATGVLSFEIGEADANGTMQSRLVGQTVTVEDPSIPVKATFRNDLKPGTAYAYKVTAADGSSASGKFRTPTAVGTKTGLRFGISGDWRGELAPYPSIRNAAERDLAFFVEFGDTIYADFPSPDLDKPQATTLDEYRIKHNEVYSARGGLNTWADLRGSTSVLVTIDDHEVTNDFAGGAPPVSDPRFAGDSAPLISETKLYKNGLQAFGEYNPIADETFGDTGDPRTANKPKLYRFREYGGDAAVFVLDARTFRDTELPDVGELNKENVAKYLAAAFDPKRTMLGRAQIDLLKADLLQAQKDGVTWKFVLVPEPIQNLGVVNASDRFEGYAAERTELLKFVKDNKLTNVVFVTADIHGTLVNNLFYQETPGGEQIPVDSWEISTGPVAFDAPFGPTVVDLAAQFKFINAQQKALYGLAPANVKENILTQLVDGQIKPLGYDPIGLEGSSIGATLVSGGWTATSYYGWTEFQIDRDSQELRVITYGIPFYTVKQAEDSAKIAAMQPTVISEFTVKAK
jgi:alkaline phosphatase D